MTHRGRKAAREEGGGQIHCNNLSREIVDILRKFLWQSSFSLIDQKKFYLKKKLECILFESLGSSSTPETNCRVPL